MLILQKKTKRTFEKIRSALFSSAFNLRNLRNLRSPLISEECPELFRGRSRSEIELPEILGAEILEVFLELIGAQLARVRRSARDTRRLIGLFLDLDRGEQRFCREDRGGEAKRDGDRIRGTRVDLHDVVAAIYVQLGVVGVLLDARDLNPTQRSAQAEDEVLAKIVGERPHPLDAMDLHDDGLGLGLADPDRQQARSALFLKDQNVRLGRTVETESSNDDFDHVALGLRVRILSGRYRGDGSAAAIISPRA